MLEDGVYYWYWFENCWWLFVGWFYLIKNLCFVNDYVFEVVGDMKEMLDSFDVSLVSNDFL